MKSPEVSIVEDREALASEAATRIVAAAEAAIAARGAFHIALAGGSTPAAIYSEVARRRSDFAHWHVWFGDERFVPATHDDSNLRMASEALLSRVAIPAAHVHAVPTGEADADSAARAYERELAALPRPSAHAPPRFDLVLLGMGSDGHTASLFPGDEALSESARWAVAARPASSARERITLTFPILNAAREVLFLVAGAEKAAALERVLAGADELPATRIRPADGHLAWLVDRAAAASRP